MAFLNKVIYCLQLVRVTVVILVFILGSISIVTTQVAFKVLFGNYPNTLYAVVALTKKHFIVLLTAILQAICPSKIRITSDLTSIPKGSFRVVDGQLRSALSDTSVVIANHQIYTDWVFLWWITYTANLSESVFIMLKDSLKRLPLLGWGMQNFRFIFLSRKWDKDSQVIESELKETERLFETDKWPYCLILFPEGTNMSPSRRSVSDNYCAKLHRDKMRNVLLPRKTGLLHSLRTLRKSCNVVYDVTIGYSGVKQQEYGELIYTLGDVFIRGKSPKITDMYFRAINLNEIPLGKDIETVTEKAETERKFEAWLFGVWDSKDALLDDFYKYGTFTPTSDPLKHEVVTAGLKIASSFELLQVFAVSTIILLLARILLKLVLSLASAVLSTADAT